MPYFYKVSDYLDSNSMDQKRRWLNKVDRTITDFSHACGVRYAADYADPEELDVFLVRSDNLIPHPTGLEFEYFTRGEVPRESILGYDDVFLGYESEYFTIQDIDDNGEGDVWLNNAARTRLIAFLNHLRYIEPPFHYNNIFIHITCSGRQDSILANGIGAEGTISPEDQIGNRTWLKYLKYKTKYLELKNKLVASAREL
jgi:hypothetical protein